MRAEPERSRWRGEGVRIDQVATELTRLHHSHQRQGHGHALARTLNLIVAPSSPRARSAIDAALAGLGDHSPSRTLELRRHRSDRLDAEVVLECQLADVAGRVGLCHDRVLLTADDSRLEHAASLLAPLLPDLPTVLWLPEPGSSIPDERLLERAQQVLVDSGVEDGDALRRLADLARIARVHDLAWGRLEFWRAATASAFEPPERQALLPRITRLDVAYEGDALAAGLLLVGWITARAGWRPQALERDDGGAVGTAERGDGGQVALSLTRDPHGRGCGGIEALVFSAGPEEVRVARGAATNSLRDLFAEALQPMSSFARGYVDAICAAAPMLER